MKHIVDPLIQDVPRLVINKLVKREDFAYFIDKSAGCQSPTKASNACLKDPQSFFTGTAPAKSGVKGGGGFNRVAQEVCRLFGEKGPDGIVALKQEIEMRRSK